MSLEVEFALVGTGIAPLIAAYRLVLAGKTVQVLNSDVDFFGENSELSFDPFFLEDPRKAVRKQLERSSPHYAYEKFSESYPGAIEVWPHSLLKSRKKGAAIGSENYHDENAPYLRARSCLWVFSDQSLGSLPVEEKWEVIEEMYLEAFEAGVRPDMLEGLVAATRFPAFSGRLDGELQAIMIPRLHDIDVNRYRNGILEYLREKQVSMITQAKQFELHRDGLRFQTPNGKRESTRVTGEVLFFWTPRMNRVIQSLMKDNEKSKERSPTGVRVWEDWELLSKEPINPESIGVFENMIVWSKIEGAPRSGGLGDILGVLKKGPLLSLDEFYLPSAGLSLAAGESLEALMRLCNGFLNWDKFSVRRMTPRMVFEWESSKEDCSILLSGGPPSARVISQCDGPLIDILENTLESLKAHL